MQLPPATCACVGDTIDRDVVGARRVGYGLVIQIESFLSGRATSETLAECVSDRDMCPGALIQNLVQIVDFSAPTGRQ